MTVLGVEWGATYTLTGPDGTIAVFNDETSPNYVGMLTPDSSGLDSAEVRESADDIPEGDGATHGTFYEGRRPVVLNGVIRHSDKTDRNTKIDRLRRATYALAGDATLLWTPTGGEPVILKLRRQQPLRVAGGWVKAFQAALVAADPRIYSDGLNTTGDVVASGVPGSGRDYPRDYAMSYGSATSVGQANVVNEGDATAPPVIKVYGPGVNPSIENSTAGKTISLIYTLAAGEYLEIDPLNGTVLLNGVTNRYGSVDFANTNWWGLLPGVNDIRLRYYSYTAGAKMKIDWRDAYL